MSGQFRITMPFELFDIAMLSFWPKVKTFATHSASFGMKSEPEHWADFYNCIFVSKVLLNK